MKQITLYSNGCPQCRVLKYKLKEKKIQFEEVSDIDYMVKKGFKSMPMLEVDENIMTYSQALKWLND